jgi:mono/diheme cytochrome c family protein
MMSKSNALLTVLTLTFATTGRIHAQSPAATAVPDGGRVLFSTYCASCHGIGGRGDAPAADELRHRPANLTRFAGQNGGVFDGPRIRDIIDGRNVKAHGTMEMAIWGDAFKWRHGLSEEGIRARVEAVVRFLETIQERAGH